MYGLKGEVPEDEYIIPIGVADIKRKGKDITIIAYSKMLHLALDAAKELEILGIDAEVVDPRTIRPLDVKTIVDSVKKTGRAVIIEEGWRFGGVGAEIANIIYDNAFSDLDAPVERVTSLDLPMPYARNLEQAILPSKERVIEAVKRVCYI
jgi:pyruvate dehydrogenase E1 component beta subunit